MKTGSGERSRPLRALLALAVTSSALGCAVLAAAAASSGSSGVAEAQSPIVPGYTSSELMIPMRDGIRLHAQVWRPQNRSEKLPILLIRSPYGFPDPAKLFQGEYKELAKDGYIFVLQDIRGRFQSEGDFVMIRPLRDPSDAKAVDESTDAFDTIDWLVRMLPGNNGRVGAFGVSYLGWTTLMTALSGHPALKAISEQASSEDNFIGDDFHHNGAFRLNYSWEFSARMESDGRTQKPFKFGMADTFDWYLRQPSLEGLDRREAGRELPTWRDFVEHPDYDQFWQNQVTSRTLPKQPKIPNLNVAGWWDAEDFYGPLAIYARQERHDTRNLNYLVVGPWDHGGWARENGRELGPIDFGRETSVEFRRDVQAPWFAYWLKGKGRLNQPEALIYQTGSNVWKRYASWPPKTGVKRASLYLRENGGLSFTRPVKVAGADSYVSDPADPVPFIRRPIIPKGEAGSVWKEWRVQDQSFVSNRPDVLTWKTAPLNSDVVISGDVVARLFAATTGTDADWVVKLIDVYPDRQTDAPAGHQLMVANEVFRARYRDSFSKPRPVPANKAVSYTVDLHSASHRFRKGHRIMVQIQSSWFPLIDRNPQRFVSNIYKAKAADFQRARQTIFRNAGMPSHVEVMVETP